MNKLVVLAPYGEVVGEPEALDCELPLFSSPIPAEVELIYPRDYERAIKKLGSRRFLSRK